MLEFCVLYAIKYNCLNVAVVNNKIPYFGAGEAFSFHRRARRLPDIFLHYNLKLAQCKSQGCEGCNI